ncbi:MucBP domain-containing protein [Candidatus Enterococcus murrayae]|uniref:MucBP domain-containing protein n=1 Tax=Candidatus Enterococcus murrayae TaxID=2815321 RepID=A0ABS3HIK7_9ENTE|nr:MucBP domain-containing protein [Enterococcus sp. MJM16]MBO0452837.1 MucBP domain-containing protein [Enterococcus sp. MJM16]
MKKNKWIFLIGFAMSIFLLGAAGQTVSADEITVDTIVGLQDAVKNAPENRTVLLGGSFPTDIGATIALAESPYQVEIDGGGVTLQSTTGKQLFSYGAGSGTASSALTLKNFNLQGLGNNARALSVSGYKGEFILENTVVNNFRGYDDGSAFYTSGNTTLKSCTFSNNVNNASGYSGGAIACKGYSANFKTYNTKFIANETLQAGTGNVGGEGGAIYFFQPSASAKFTFKNNYFAGNKSVENVSGGGKAKLADGGAIAFFNTVNGTDILFDGNSFVGNIAGDDGGAILIQTNDNISSAATFVNNTFYQNKALGQDLSANNGGAIQIYANGGITEGRRAAVDYINNSFVENTAVYDGGAIGSSGYGLNYSAGRYANNLFAGNKARSATKSNIADGKVDGTGNLESNLGYDNGTATTVTMADVFGSVPVGLVDNYNKIKAGTSSDAIILPTVPIAPEKLADDQVENLRAVNEDQRGLPRTAKADIGSVEIDWIKYDSNGGIFDLGTELPKYEGIVYYEGTQPEAYYQVGYKDLNQTIPAGADLKATRDGYQFAGWSKDKDAKDPDANLAAGQSLTIPKGNETLYAIWKKSEPVIVHYMTYDENKQLVQISPDETLTGDLGTSYHAQIKQIDDYVFSGVKEGDSITGIFSDEPKEITLIYTKAVKEKGTVLVQYQDESGKPLAGNEMSMGEIGNDYTTTQKNIDGYTFKEIKGASAGKYVSGITQVIYVYTKNPAEQGKVIVHYQDEEQNPLCPDVELTGDVDAIYTAEVKPFDDYTVKGIVGSISGKYTLQNQEVTVIYAKKGTGVEKGVLIVEYQDEAGHPLLNSDVTLAEIGEEYTTTPKEIDGYKLKEVKGSEAGKYVDGITKVTYVYEAIKGKVTIRYHDEAGNELAENYTDEQPIGTPLPLEKLNKDIAGFQLKEIKGLAMDTGARYTKAEQVITVIYKKQAGMVIVNYLSDEGKSLAKPLTLSGQIGAEYQTEAKAFKGYRLKETTGNAAGKYDLAPQIVTYIYTNKSSIKVQYVDEAGKELAPAEQKIGVIDEKYETTAKAIDGWKVKETPKNAQGTYQAEEQTITYVYLKATPAEGSGDGGANDGGGQSNTGATTYVTTRALPNTGRQQATAKKLPATGEERTSSLVLTLIGLGLTGYIGMTLLKRRVNE